MFKNTRQEFCIKSVPLEEITLLEDTLNNMSKDGYELYSMHEGELNNKMVYNLIFVKEVEVVDDTGFEDIQGYKTKMEKMLYAKDQPYELCLNFQKKINETREKIDNIKHFLDGAKEDEREVLNEEIAKEVDRLNNLKKQLRNLLSPSKMAANLGEERLSINLSEEIYCLNEPNKKQNLLAQTVKTRQELTQELGYIIPKVQFVENSELDEFSFTINVHAVPVIEAKVYPDSLVFFEDELSITKFPKGSIKEVDKLTGRKIVWIKTADCEDFWAKGLYATEYIEAYLKYFAIKHVQEIFNYADLNRYIEIVSENNALLIDNILGEYISLSELKYIFCQLLRERVSVKDVIYIFEKINDFAEDECKTDLLDKLRIALNRQICWSLSNENKEIEGYEISKEVILLLEKQAENQEEGESIVRIDGSKFLKFTQGLKKLTKGQNVVLVAPQAYRQMLFVLVSQLYADIPVICYEEISPEFELKVIGNI